MCNYVRKNKCAITNEVCPYMYYCTKRNIWKQSSNMPENCKVKQAHSVPKGYYKVLFERRGMLYILIEDQTIPMQNPFDHVPLFVKLRKSKDGHWFIVKTLNKGG